MSRKTHSKSGKKSRYRRRPISARASNRKGAVTWRTCFLLRWGRKTNRNKLLAKVTAVIFRPTAERASALLRGSKVTCYFRRGAGCYRSGRLWHRFLRGATASWSVVGAGRSEAALTVTEAAIQGAMAVLIFRKQHKPALGPVGDSLDDVGALT